MRVNSLQLWPAPSARGRPDLSVRAPADPYQPLLLFNSLHIHDTSTHTHTHSSCKMQMSFFSRLQRTHCALLEICGGFPPLRIPQSEVHVDCMHMGELYDHLSLCQKERIMLSANHCERGRGIRALLQEEKRRLNQESIVSVHKERKKKLPVLLQKVI